MTQERRGELYLLGHSLFESLFPIVTLTLVAQLGAMHSYALTVAFSVIFFTAVMYTHGTLGELKKREALKPLLLTALFITLLFMLIFSGLRYTTSGNAAVIIFMQLFFSFVYFNLFGSEKLHAMHLLGALLMGAGALFILFPEQFSLNRGDALILAAAAIAPLANLWQKRARAVVRSETIMTFRSLVALPFLLLFAWLSEPTPQSGAVVAMLPLLLLNGFFLMGASKLLWIEAIFRVSITKASALIAFTPLFTMLIAYFTLNEIPTLQQLFGAFLIVGGSYAITRRAR